MVVAADWSRWLQVGVAVCLVFLLCIGTTPQPAAAQEGTVVGLPGLSAFAPDNRIVGGGQVTLDVYLTNEGRLVRGGGQDGQ
jgi:hypothetical protein